MLMFKQSDFLKAKPYPWVHFWVFQHSKVFWKLKHLVTDYIIYIQTTVVVVREHRFLANYKLRVSTYFFLQRILSECRSDFQDIKERTEPWLTILSWSFFFPSIMKGFVETLVHFLLAFDYNNNKSRRNNSLNVNE